MFHWLLFLLQFTPPTNAEILFQELDLQNDYNLAFSNCFTDIIFTVFFHFAKDCNSNWEKCWNATRNSNFVIFMMQTDAFHYCVFRFFSLFIVLLQCYGPLLSNFLYIRIIVSNSTTKFYKIISICIYTPAIV